MLAPEHDMDAYQFDDLDARPGYYKKTPIIRHPVHLNGMISHFYVKPNREVVWKINFLNGHGSPQRYKAVDVVAAVDPRNGIARAPPCWLIPQDEDGEDSSLLNSVAASSSSLGIGWWRDSEESPCVVLQGICLR
jgi:hypothetical protein